MVRGTLSRLVHGAVEDARYRRKGRVFAPDCQYALETASFHAHVSRLLSPSPKCTYTRCRFLPFDLHVWCLKSASSTKKLTLFHPPDLHQVVTAQGVERKPCSASPHPHYNETICVFVLTWGRYSLAHPFLLSDNRHYPFYVWQRLLSRVYVRVALAPVYVFCGWLVTSRLLRRKPPLWVLTYAGAAAVVLVPSPLLEPRWDVDVVVVFAVVEHG